MHDIREPVYCIEKGRGLTVGQANGESQSLVIGQWSLKLQLHVYLFLGQLVF